MIIDILKNIYHGEKLEDKLFAIDLNNALKELNNLNTQYLELDFILPNRNKQIEFSSKQRKFPNKNKLKETSSKAFALSSFANHELMAIELMAYAILYFPNKSKEDLQYKKGLLSALIDEQKHFNLYVSKMENLGYSFGEFELNNFFFNFMKEIKNLKQFSAMMNLTFESANLDFANYYHNLFKENGDDDIAAILNQVFIDEIKHVSLGVNYFKKDNKSLWEEYISSLVHPLTPARAKGINFNIESRKKAKMDEEFILKLKNFNDNFAITKRKN